MEILKSLSKMAVVFAAALAVSSQSFAQTPPAPAGAPVEKGKGASGPRKQLATIIFAGLGGAILGLSTLSFYGRPQEKLNNIPIGFAIGVIVGTTFVTYRAATNPSELYGRQLQLEREAEPQNAFTTAQTAGPLAPLGGHFAFEF